jgi:putative oxidoreductase
MNEQIEKLGEFLRATLGWLPPLLARITIGYVFIEAGWGKLHHLDSVTQFFVSLGIPLAQIQAPVVSFLEFFCGVLILVGFLTRLASLPLIGTMVVAITTAKIKALTGLSALFGFIEYLYIVLLVWLLIEGAGALSLDKLISKILGSSKRVD